MPNSTLEMMIPPTADPMNHLLGLLENEDLTDVVTILGTLILSLIWSLI